MQPQPSHPRPILLCPPTVPMHSRADRLRQGRECHVCCEAVVFDVDGDLVDGEHVVCAGGAA